MPCATPCKNCDRKGLPILFTRYAAAYSAQAKGMTVLKAFAPAGQFQVNPNGVDMKAAAYNVRMLRPGYLYVRIESSCRAPKWHGYIVHPHGYLAEFPVEAPESAKPAPACEVEIRGSIASMVWVEDAKNVTNFNYLFHPDPIDYQRLKSEIEPNLGKYTQSFDVAGWANGSMSQKNTSTPALLNAQVIEFAALDNEALRDAIEPQIYGLMGANPQERGWGDYEDTEQQTVYTPMGDAAGSEAVAISVKGQTYVGGHGPRLKKMAAMLKDKKGAVVACEDPVGIAQELGYLQAEAWTPYTHWQNDQCPGHFKGVSNEWVYQTAMGATGLMEMIKKGAVAKAQAHIEDWNANARPAPAVYRDEATRAAELARREAAKKRNQQAERDGAGRTGDADYAALFDQAAARDIKAAQSATYDDVLKLIDALGADQVAWLKATPLMNVIERYSPLDPKVHLPGGGAALSLQLAQSLTGIESNKAGKALLQMLDPAGWNLLGRALSFNSVTVQATLKALNTSAARATLPDAQPTTAVADWITDKLKFQAGTIGLGDKALGFIAAAPHIADSASLRKMAWPLHIASLMSVKMMQGVANLPATALEARVVRFAAMTGITTLGSTAAEYAQTLTTAERSRLINAVGKIERKGGHIGAARTAVPNARAAALSALFDAGFALIKGYQLSVKADTRTSMEMVGNMFQGIGSIADFRAKAYEETVQKGLRGKNLFTAAAQAESLDLVNAMHLRGLRITAFKFLLPAAMISVWWDVKDALTSRKRGQIFLSIAQFAGALGTVFTITATGMVAYGTILGISASTWAMAAATLGLIGAVLVLGALVAVLILKDDEWLNWLRDNPLNKQRKGQKPIHDNLQDTLQQLANAQAAA